VKRIARIVALATVSLIVLALAFHNLVLSQLGAFLVKAEPPEKADIALVLAGDNGGNRILTAAQLVRSGFVPKVAVSGPSGIYGYHECDLAIPFAAKAGYPESYFIHLEHDARSTKEEAAATIPRLRQMGVHKVLLVTSNYHTRRAGRIFRSAAPDLEFVVVAAPDPDFTTSGWWHNRQGEKTVFMEWIKTVTAPLGI
jgi:uncharacterized SAM-binding protein YcdF (DUF218 family)